MNDIAVVVPVYKKDTTKYDEISLLRLRKTLNNRQVFFITHKKLNLRKYERLFPEVQRKNFDASFFDSIQGYNRLMLSRRFYSNFAGFKYILIYQLDAYLFKDNLDRWIDKNFDYIGAPWINWEYQSKFKNNAPAIRKMWWKLFGAPKYFVGNGGFSLRKVKTFVRVLDLFQKKSTDWGMFEDTFWPLYIKTYYPIFQIPDYKTALEFSFETSPQTCYELNGKKLPTGCHGWYKIDEKFWRRFIDI